MTQEVLKLAENYAKNRANYHIESLYGTNESYTATIKKAMLEAHQALKEALAQTQEPVAWQWLDTAHFRKKLPKDAGDGVWNPLYAAPQRTERPVDCERCNRLEEQAYDLVGKLRVANIKLSMQPQRTWVGLTDEDISEIVRGTHNTGSFVRAIEAKLKEKNT